MLQSGGRPGRRAAAAACSWPDASLHVAYTQPTCLYGILSVWGREHEGAGVGPKSGVPPPQNMQESKEESDKCLRRRQGTCMYPQHCQEQGHKTGHHLLLTSWFAFTTASALPAEWLSLPFAPQLETCLSAALWGLHLHWWPGGSVSTLCMTEARHAATQTNLHLTLQGCATEMLRQVFQPRVPARTPRRAQSGFVAGTPGSKQSSATAHH